MIFLPHGFINQLKPLLGSGLPDFIDSFNKPAHRGIRFSARRNAPLVGGLLSPIPWYSGAYYLENDATAGGHPLHDAGAYYLQEPSAMAAVSALKPQPGDRVLDLCAAPGGKASQIGDSLKGKGALLANEINPTRARILARNLERMGIMNAAVSSESPARLAEKLPHAFDKILVDAPCSGEGMFRREPDSQNQWRPESPAGCALRQKEILHSASLMLKPGGKLLYSTCTFNETENEGVIQDFLKQHPAFHLIPFDLPGLPAARQGMLRIWPHLHQGEGHFIALMTMAGEAPLSSANSLAPLPDANDAINEWADFSCDANLTHSHTVYHQSPCLPDLAGLRLLSPGAALAERQGKLWKPAHALALICQPHQVVSLDVEEAFRFQQGHPLLVDTAMSGWAAPTLEGWPLGWGKATGGILKNHYPKGLRRPL